MLGSNRQDSNGFNIWPGFVDVLATILLVFVFVLLFFALAQFYLSDALFGRTQALDALEQEVAGLEEMLSMERRERGRLEERSTRLESELHATLAAQATLRGELELTEAQRARLQEQLAASEELTVELEEELEQRMIAVQALRSEITETEAALAAQRQLSAAAEARVDALRRDVRALREQLTAVAEALGISDASTVLEEAGVEGLGQRLNVALAERVQELDRYRSEFFGRLQEVLADVDEIEVVGDRFRFQSELFFASASARVGSEGRQTLQHLADTVQEILQRMPEDIDWVLQVEGHTDQQPIRTERFPSNWELSTARATNIVHYLIDAGIPADRVAATGFGEYHPLDPRNTPEAWARNRRIELRLTSR